MKKIITILLLFFTTMYAKITNNIVDEARTVTIMGSDDDISSSEPTRAIKVDGNITVYKDDLNLSTAKKEFKIEIKKPFAMPNTLSIKRDDNITSKIKSGKSQKRIEFIIQKSDLKSGDKIIIETIVRDKIVELTVVK